VTAAELLQAEPDADEAFALSLLGGAA